MVEQRQNQHALGIFSQHVSEPHHSVSFNKRTHASTLYKAVLANKRLEQLERKSFKYGADVQNSGIDQSFQHAL